MADLDEFLSRHPRVQFELSSRGLDCVVRVGLAADPGVLVRPLGHMSLIKWASPAHRGDGFPDSSRVSQRRGVAALWACVVRSV
jgi:DNA-binding transcriptional LysR family regulator